MLLTRIKRYRIVCKISEISQIALMSSSLFLHPNLTLITSLHRIFPVDILLYDTVPFITLHVSVGKTGDQPMMSLGSMDIGVLADWNELIDVLRSSEKKFDEKEVEEKVQMLLTVTLAPTKKLAKDGTAMRQLVAEIAVSHEDTISTISEKVQKIILSAVFFLHHPPEFSVCF